MRVDKSILMAWSFCIPEGFHVCVTSLTSQIYGSQETEGIRSRSSSSGRMTSVVKCIWTSGSGGKLPLNWLRQTITCNHGTEMTSLEICTKVRLVKSESQTSNTRASRTPWSPFVKPHPIEKKTHPMCRLTCKKARWVGHSPWGSCVTISHDGTVSWATLLERSSIAFVRATYHLVCVFGFSKRLMSGKM